MKVPFSYLDRQFYDVDAYLAEIKELVLSGDFTLGTALTKFEGQFAQISGMPYAIGVASGTDAIIYSLKALNIGPGDEVITTPMTFIATVGAIVMAGATPVFVDSDDGFVINAAKIEEVITSKTKAIMPVHYSGNVADMPAIKKIASKYGLHVIEDACQAIGATLDGKEAGSWGETACYSLHPLKNLNVWSDAGVITSRSEELSSKLKLLRNHGLKNRDVVSIFGGNSRMDNIQAIVGNRIIGQMEWITQKRIENADFYDNAFADISDINIPIRRSNVKHVYHLYIIRVERRDELLASLIEKGIEAKIHYPIPVHLQEAAKYLGYKKGDFPNCEKDCKRIITLPVHQHLSDEELNFTINMVRKFYRQ